MVSVLSLFQQLAFDLQHGAETEYFLKETGAFLKRPFFEQGTAGSDGFDLQLFVCNADFTDAQLTALRFIERVCKAEDGNEL